MSRTEGYSPARARDFLLMDALSAVLTGGDAIFGDGRDEDLCQLGYAADLVRLSVQDADGRLEQLVQRCRNVARHSAMPEGVTPRDPAQALWKARYPLDARKLRLELPLHVKRKTLLAAA